MPGSLGARDNYGDTPAHLAAFNGHVELSQYIAVASQLTPLMIAVLLREHKRVKRLLSLQGSDPRIGVVYNGITHSAQSLSTYQPQYTWGKEVCLHTNWYLDQSLSWSPKNHRLFPPAFRRG